MRFKFVVSFVLVNFSMLVASCSESGSTSSETAFESRAGYVWLLESYGNDENNLAKAATTAQFTLQFNQSSDRAISSFSGYDGCNHFGAEVVSAETGHLEVVNSINQDGQFCEELLSAEYTSQHDYLYVVLESYFSFEYNDDERMRLRTVDSKLIVFKRCGLIDEQMLSQECLL